jgi:DhnA family fructose-bisphosphate aldolase class Ia
VLVRGGGKASDQEILERTEALIKQGAAGIVYGRNVIQHENPAGITRALMAIVHDGTTAAGAAKLLKERA